MIPNAVCFSNLIWVGTAAIFRNSVGFYETYIIKIFLKVRVPIFLSQLHSSKKVFKTI
ncbi:hypothetical protein LEP1GSC172_4271 [Leptospira noguchii]|uniref:Uncharacterized protein n=1 Tax=Leptospira noguchii TaxID=28182 RepID=M6VCR6_9LEPT|nr:hypothetical protein LEP1GSC172_4271 [Leptospira noguchii]